MDAPPGGIKRGREEIRVSIRKIFSGPGRHRFEFYDYSLHEAGELFNVGSRARGGYRAAETVLNMAIRTTRVFRLVEGVSGGRYITTARLTTRAVGGLQNGRQT